MSALGTQTTLALPRRVSARAPRGAGDAGRGARGALAGVPAPGARAARRLAFARGIAGRDRFAPSPRPTRRAAARRGAAATRAVQGGVGGNAYGAPGGDGGRPGGGVLGWLARQLGNQVKAVPLLRWPSRGFFSHRTWIAVFVDSVVVVLALVAMTLVMGGADIFAAKLYHVIAGTFR